MTSTSPGDSHVTATLGSHDHFSYLFACKGLCEERGGGRGEGEGNISEWLVHLLQREGKRGGGVWVLIPFQTNVRFTGKHA